MSKDLMKEKQEAIEAGERALYSLRQAQSDLNSAKNWGLVDMFGGGFISTMVKRSKLESAQEHMRQARYDLRSFSRELNDVSTVYNLNIDIDDFLSFADWFFDGFIVDWMVQDKINSAREKVTDAIRKVEDMMSKI